jgi:hypothetical protein
MLRHTPSEESGYTDSYRHRYEQRPEQSHDQPHYDTATACAVIERAAELQAEEEALTAADIEAMAEQSGVNPLYVRRVLARMQESGSLPTRSSTLVTARERRWMTTYPLAYGAFLFTQMYWLVKPYTGPLTERYLIPALIFVLPGLLAFYLGARLGKTSRGLRAGISVALATCAAVVLGIAFFVERPIRFDSEFFGIGFATLAGGAVLGTLGAEMAKHLRKPLARRIARWLRETAA